MDGQGQHVQFAHAGGALMLYHLAALWAAFIVFSVVFARDDPRARLVAGVSISGGES